jgi:hypothetical protein
VVAGPIAAWAGVSPTQYGAAALIVVVSLLALIPRDIRRLRAEDLVGPAVVVRPAEVVVPADVVVPAEVVGPAQATVSPGAAVHSPVGAGRPN